MTFLPPCADLEGAIQRGTQGTVWRLMFSLGKNILPPQLLHRGKFQTANNKVEYLSKCLLVRLM